MIRIRDPESHNGSGSWKITDPLRIRIRNPAEVNMHFVWCWKCVATSSLCLRMFNIYVISYNNTSTGTSACTVYRYSIWISALNGLYCNLFLKILRQRFPQFDNAFALYEAWCGSMIRIPKNLYTLQHSFCGLPGTCCWLWCSVLRIGLALENGGTEAPGRPLGNGTGPTAKLPVWRWPSNRRQVLDNMEIFTLFVEFYYVFHVDKEGRFKF